MSDLAATNCGCGCENEGGCNSIIWLIILLCCCGCGNNGIGGGCDNGNNSCLWLILLLFCCGGNGCGGGCFQPFCFVYSLKRVLLMQYPFFLLYRKLFRDIPLVPLRFFSRLFFSLRFRSHFCSHSLFRSSCSLWRFFSRHSSSISYTLFPSMISFPIFLLLFLILA